MLSACQLVKGSTESALRSSQQPRRLPDVSLCPWPPVLRAEHPHGWELWEQRCLPWIVHVPRVSSFGRRICEFKAMCTRRFCSCVLCLVQGVGQQRAFPAGQKDGLDIRGCTELPQALC